MSGDPDLRPVIVFDGACVLCNGWVRFLLHHDVQQRYRFAAMQTAAGRALLVGHGVDPEHPVSFLLVENGRAWSDADAIIRVASGLGRPWRMARALKMVPRVFRDRLYRLAARNRYRWFGRRQSCLLPLPGQEDRFLS